MGLVYQNLICRDNRVPTEPISPVMTVSNTATATSSIAIGPVGSSTGDLLLYFVTQNQFGAVQAFWSPPAGYTELQDWYSPISAVGWKRQAASEGSATHFSSASGNILIYLLAWRNAAVDRIGDRSTTVINDQTITLPAVSVTSNNSRVFGIVFSTGASSNITLPAGWAVDQVTTGNPGMVIFSKVVQAGSTGTVSVNFTGGSGSHSGCLLAIREIEPIKFVTSFAQTGGFTNSIQISSTLFNTNTQDGDLLILTVATSNASANFWNNPAGWTQRASFDTPGFAVYEKIRATGGETSSPTFTWGGGNGQIMAVCVVYRYAVIQSFGSVLASEVSTRITIGSMTTTSANNLSLVFVYSDNASSNLTTVESMNLVQNVIVPSFGQQLAVFSYVAGRIGATGERRFTRAGASGPSRGVQIGLAPTG